MSVELKVTLVGEDPQQQQAFNNPATAQGAQPGQATSSVQPEPTQTASAQAPSSPSVNAPSSRPSAAPSSSSGPQQQPVDARLIDSIDELIAALDELTQVSKPVSGSSAGGQPPAVGSSQPDSWLDRLSRSIDSKIEAMGLQGTTIGNMVSGLGSRVAGLGTRAATFASSVFGTGAGAAANAAGGAAGSAGSGAAAGAAGGAGGAAAGGLAAGATAGAAVAGPLVAVALAAGLAALSVKKFMEAVDSVAKDLVNLSPEIGIGQAQYEARAEFARLDRARRIGPEVAGLNNAQNRLNESMYELQTKIYELVLKAAPAIEFGANVVDVGISQLNAQFASVLATMALFTRDKDDNKRAEDALMKANKSLNDALLRLAGLPTQQERDDSAMIESMLGFGNQQQQPQQLAPPRRRRRGQ